MKKTILRSIYTLVILSSTTLWAQNSQLAPQLRNAASTQSSQTKVKVVKAEEPKNWSASFEISRSSSLYDFKDGNKYESMDYSASFAYVIDNSTISTRLGYSQNLNTEDPDPSVLNDSNITYSYKPEPLMNNPEGVKIGWGPTVTAIIPISEYSRNVDQLQTAVIGSVGLKILAGDKTSLTGLGMSLGLSLGQNFHRFETNKDGTILGKNSSNQSVGVFYSYGDFSFSMSYANRIRWPYAGEPTQTFDMSEDISYTYSKNVWIYVGHSNSGMALKPNGQDSNISLIDEDNSVVYLGVGYSL